MTRHVRRVFVCLVLGAMLVEFACVRCIERERESAAHGSFAMLCFECTTDFLNASSSNRMSDVYFDHQDPSRTPEMAVLLDAWIDRGMV